MKEVDGKPFECKRCGECCRWEGRVYLKDTDIREISRLLEIEPGEFLEKYTDRENGGTVLIDKPGTSDCVFLEGNDCSIWDSLPYQCRELPRHYESRCPGFEKDGSESMKSGYERALEKVRSKLAQEDAQTKGLLDKLYRGLQSNRTASEEDVPRSGMDDFLSEDRVKVASLGDLIGFDRVGKDHLIHKSSKDLWGIDMDEEGNVHITRMFDNDGEPIKG